jgi:hydroxyethylthiazole kinase-like uncharacterized protein yjeF
MSDSIIRLTRAQVREVDRRAIENYHIPGIVLMENAGLHAADVAFKMLDSLDAGVAIVCGPGNNGGDGLAIARHLLNRGIYVDIILADVTPGFAYKGDAAINAEIIHSMGQRTYSIYDSEDILNPHAMDFVIDALFGTGLTRPLEGDTAKLIELMNECGLPILAIDLPSGLDCDTGTPLGPACIRATRTVTFVAEKAGFANPNSKQFTGPVTIADIGCPKSLIAQVIRDVPA